MDLRMSDVLAALSHALDLGAGRLRGHAERACLIGMRLAATLGLSDAERATLLRALLLKDGGSELARRIGLDDATADAIGAAREHWDGRGEPHGSVGEEIPPLGRIICLAETAEEAWRGGGPGAASAVALERRGSWFDPVLVDALCTIEADERFWRAVEYPLVFAWEPAGEVATVDDTGLDRIAEGFGAVVDARSTRPGSHSSGVARLSVELGYLVGLGERERRDLRRAALLRDLGMLGVPERILVKPGRLDAEERRVVELHPKTSLEILSRVGALRTVARLAAVHHERLDGSGYFLGLTGRQLDLSTRVLAVADVAHALGSMRPYRDAFAPDEVLWLIAQGAGRTFDAEVFESLAALLTETPDLEVAEEVDAQLVHGLEGLGVEASQLVRVEQHAHDDQHDA